MTHAIQLFNHIDSLGTDLLTQAGHDVSASADNPTAILCRSHNCHELRANPSLLAIARAGAGVNNIPCDDMLEQGVLVFNTPGANANAVKELVIGSLLLGSRHLLQAHQATLSLSGDAADMSKTVESIKKQFTGQEIQGRTLGVIGLGHIGVLVANAAIALGMDVIGYDPMIRMQQAWQLSSQVKRADSLEALCQQSEYISIHVPLLDATKGLINTSLLNAMKPGTIVANFSRAGIVDIDAIKEALSKQHIQSYLCDFPHPDLQDTPQAICLPHLGASTAEATSNCAVMAAKQLNEFLAFGHLKNCIHFPDTSLPPSSNTRLTIINRNVPNMVAQLSSTLSQHNVNIDTFINRSQGTYAYNILDLDSNVNDTVLEALNAIDGILKVRVVY